MMRRVALRTVSIPKVSLRRVALSDKQKERKPAFWDVDNLLLEDGSNLLLENGGCVLLEFTPPHLILESEDKLLQENGNYFIL